MDTPAGGPPAMTDNSSNWAAGPGNMGNMGGGMGNMGGGMGGMGNGAASAGPTMGNAPMFHRHSDRRLKRYIHRVGQSKRGFVLYSFQYIWGGPFYVGVMAQDLLATCPEAVSVGPDNYFMVDYSKLDVKFTTLSEWRSGSQHVNASGAPAELEHSLPDVGNEF